MGSRENGFAVEARETIVQDDIRPFPIVEKPNDVEPNRIDIEQEELG